MSGPTNAPSTTWSGNIARRPADYALDFPSEDGAANASGAIKQKVCRAMAGKMEGTQSLRAGVLWLGAGILELSTFLEMIGAADDAWPGRASA